VAVDISPRMIAVARRKVADNRVAWHTVDVRRLPLGAASCNRVICYSVWPHFENKQAVSAELARVLVPGGLLHVWHVSSRHRINEIHATAGEAVAHDILPAARETAELLLGAGFRISTCREDGPATESGNDASHDALHLSRGLPALVR
jgi:ubiquinone/menaquinone biosynthesis C-methylase UbiE